jgi:SAM-dependent methyltransferase
MGEGMTKPDEFWVDYYAQVCNDGPSWVDYSNERVHLQTLGLVLEASDRLNGRSVLDIGCGQGQLCRMARSMGASETTGVDLADASVDRLSQAYPHQRWLAGDFTAAAFRESLETYDLVYLIEVMQFLPVPDVFDWVWAMLRPGGRLVAMFPFEGCPIVQRTSERFGGRYVAPDVAAASLWLQEACELETWALRGLRFQPDQRVNPYEVLSWTQYPEWLEPPNRLQLVAQKCHDATAPLPRRP